MRVNNLLSLIKLNAIMLKLATPENFLFKSKFYNINRL